MIQINLRETGTTYRTYNLNIQGDIIHVLVTRDANIAHQWITYNSSFYRNLTGGGGVLVVGLGVQWTPHPHGESPAETMQLLVGNHCLVFQLTHAPQVPHALRDFLMDPRNVFVGFRNHAHRRKLEICRHGVMMLRHPLDMRFYATASDGRSMETEQIQVIARVCLGIRRMRIVRHVTTSDWAVMQLGTRQVQQAVLLPYCSFLLGMIAQVWRLFP